MSCILRVCTRFDKHDMTAGHALVVVIMLSPQGSQPEPWGAAASGAAWWQPQTSWLACSCSHFHTLLPLGLGGGVLGYECVAFALHVRWWVLGCLCIACHVVAFALHVMQAQSLLRGLPGSHPLGGRPLDGHLLSGHLLSGHLQSLLRVLRGKKPAAGGSHPLSGRPLSGQRQRRLCPKRWHRAWQSSACPQSRTPFSRTLAAGRAHSLGIIDAANMQTWSGLHLSVCVNYAKGQS